MRIRTAAPIALAAATAMAGSLLATAAPASAAAHQGGLHFGTIQYDGPGKDDRSKKSLNAEWVNIHNNGKKKVQLKGFTVKDNTGYTYTFGSYTIGAGKTVKGAHRQGQERLGQRALEPGLVRLEQHRGQGPAHQAEREAPGLLLLEEVDLGEQGHQELPLTPDSAGSSRCRAAAVRGDCGSRTSGSRTAGGCGSRTTGEPGRECRELRPGWTAP
ncbi:hypothetical protein SMICM304S_09751 [Streptomyces microflavus]